MIKPFELTDLGAFLPNEYSNPDQVLDHLTSGQYGVESMVDDKGNVMLIMAYQNYWGNCWQGFLLVSKMFDWNAATELRKHLHAGMVANKAMRLQTESVSDDKLRKWHEFLGFTLEGTRRKMMFNRDYDQWALMREGA